MNISRKKRDWVICAYLGDERLLLGGSLDMDVPWIRAPNPREERPGGLAKAAYLPFA
jgi:hypothetical protein